MTTFHALAHGAHRSPRPQAASHIAAYDSVDHPNEAQLAALARKHFGVAVNRAQRSRA
jgi:hypothetical protein